MLAAARATTALPGSANGRVLAHAQWTTTTLPPVLDELSRIRNPGAHREPIDRETARRVRDRQLGIGGGALLDELARLRPI